MNATEILGYAASVIVAISFLIGNVRLLRIWNSAGAACFVVYGALIASYPIALLNVFIVMVNIWHIIRLQREEKS